MVSDKAKAFLRAEYGDQYFGWDIEDHHIDEILDENPSISYEQLNKKCTDLEETIRWIEAKIKEMYESV